MRHIKWLDHLQLEAAIYTELYEGVSQYAKRNAYLYTAVCAHRLCELKNVITGTSLHTIITVTVCNTTSVWCPDVACSQAADSHCHPLSLLVLHDSLIALRLADSLSTVT